MLVHAFISAIRTCPKPTIFALFNSLDEELADFVGCGFLIAFLRKYDTPQFLFIPILGCHTGHDLLSKEIKGFLRDLDCVESSFADAAQNSDGLNQLIAAKREKAALGYSHPAMVGPPYPLQEGRN